MENADIWVPIVLGGGIRVRFWLSCIFDTYNYRPLYVSSKLTVVGKTMGAVKAKRYMNLSPTKYDKKLKHRQGQNLHIYSQ